MLLRETPLSKLLERRDELQTQVNAINAEVARRNREWVEEQNRSRALWAAEHPEPRQSLIPRFSIPRP